MKTQYFCVYHAQRLQARESEAINAWSQIMRQAMNAYTECRISEAYTYLGAAIDIALLRSKSASNGIFSELHLVKPAEFLVQLHVAEHHFDDAMILLTKLSTLSTLPAPEQGTTLAQFVAFERKRIAAAEMEAHYGTGLLHGSEESEQGVAAVYPLHRH